MTAVWITIGGLVLTTAAIKAVGPFSLGSRELPRAFGSVVALLAPALLAALVLTDTFGDGQSLTVDARAAGLGCAALALVLRAPLIVVVLVAALGTALVRAVS